MSQYCDQHRKDHCPSCNAWQRELSGLARLAIIGFLIWSCTQDKGHSAEPSIDLGSLTIGPKSYTAARIVSHTPAEATIHHTQGVLTIPIEFLPPEIQTKLSFDPKAAQTFRATRAAAQRKAATARAAQAQAKARQAQLDAAPELRFTIFQLLPEEHGALAILRISGGYSGSIQSAVNSLSGRSSASYVPGEQEIVFLEGTFPPEIVDRSKLDAHALQEGTYNSDGNTLHRYVLGTITSIDP